jgi:adenine-specific DNA-methyltransferase
LLTATYDYYKLKDESRGPVGGFDYQPESATSNPKAIGPGIVQHITLKAIANGTQSEEEVLVDRPERIKEIVRVTGPFAFEATIPTPVDYEGDGIEDSHPKIAEEHGAFVERMIEILRRSPILNVGGSRKIKLEKVRPPVKSLSLSAEAFVDATAPGQRPTLDEAIDEAEEQSGGRLPLTARPVAFVFGPESGAVSEKLVYEAAREAHAKSYAHLYVIGFAIQPNARRLIEESDAAMGVAATYVQATPDLMMGDLLKTMRSSQIFSVCGRPEIAIRKAAKGANGDARWQVELLGLDTFDPVTMEVEHRRGDDVPAWFLDTDYNGLCFHVAQAFFPRTSAWENLKKALKGSHDESVWDHLAGTTSAPFEAGEHGQIAVKVIDDRGNELLVVESLGRI